MKYIFVDFSYISFWNILHGKLGLWFLIPSINTKDKGHDDNMWISINLWGTEIEISLRV